MIRTFHLQRAEDVSGQSGTGIVAVGAIYPSGRVVLEWLPGVAGVVSQVQHDSLANVERLHGHDGRTVVVLHPTTRPLLARLVARLRSGGRD